MSFLTLNDVENGMEKCYQMPGQNIKEHGLSVYKYYEDLNNYLLDKKYDLEWKFPEWIFKYKSEISVERFNKDIFYWYMVYHDCGKHFCLIVDEQGKQHFPNHAQKSYEVWTELYKNNQINISEEKNNIISKLILKDMDLHLIKANEIPNWLNENDSFTAISLLLSSLCEIHSNAKMFGENGLDSIGFKIKFKQIDKRGRQICQKLFGLK